MTKCHENNRRILFNMKFLYSIFIVENYTIYETIELTNMFNSNKVLKIGISLVFE